MWSGHKCSLGRVPRGASITGIARQWQSGVLDLTENQTKVKGVEELASRVLWGRRDRSALVEVLLKGCVIGCEGAGQLAGALAGPSPQQDFEYV